MKIRAEIRLKNHALKSAREKAGLTQKELAEAANVSPCVISQLECLDFRRISFASIVRVAAHLDLKLESILPEALNGVKVPNYLAKVTEIPEQVLLETIQRQKFLESTDFVEDLDNKIDSKEAASKLLDKLPPRQKLALQMHYSLPPYDHKNYTLADIGKALFVTRERARQIILRAERKLRSCAATVLPQYCKT